MIGAIQHQLERFGLEIRRSGYQPWQQNPFFTSEYDVVRTHTLLSKDRCFTLFQFARYLSRLNGAMAEVGVYRGGSARLIASAAPQCTIHLFDTFEGMPQVDSAIDRHKAGDFSDTSLTAVQAYLADNTNVSFHPGVFPVSVSGLERERFSFVHVDCDIYAAVSASLYFFFSRLVDGGMLIVDDYGWVGCQGVDRAVAEFTLRNGLWPLITARYQCAFIKLPAAICEAQLAESLRSKQRLTHYE